MSATVSESKSTISNFGGNVAFQPSAVFTPADEANLLRIMAEQRGKRLRVVGRLHSWSDVVRAEEVLIDLRRFDHLSVAPDGERRIARIGAGVQVKTILEKLDSQGLTLPAVGLISEQALVGAVSTGTHGSGRHSLSHYITAARVATYDATTGEPVVREIRDGDELRAIRCGLGCFGLITEVELPVREQYRVEERFARYKTLDEVLAAERDEPLQQFFFVPWQWNYLAQHRHETLAPRSWLATLYRWYWYLTIDLGLHIALSSLVRVFRAHGAKSFFKAVVPLTVIRGWRVVDKSHHMLIMEHELFRHIEIELFVRRSRLARALELSRDLIVACDDSGATLSPDAPPAFRAAGVLDELTGGGQRYTHHYPICVRRVVPDDTLLSMTSSDGRPDEDYYALSFISYARPDRRAGFQRFARLLYRCLTHHCDARPHWGKVAPLTRKDVDRLYPQAERFRELRRAADPHGRFLNEWTESLFG